MGECTGACRGVTAVRKCDMQPSGMKCIRKVCQLLERCDAHGRSVQELVEV